MYLARRYRGSDVRLYIETRVNRRPLRLYRYNKAQSLGTDQTSSFEKLDNLNTRTNYSYNNNTIQIIDILLISIK